MIGSAAWIDPINATTNDSTYATVTASGTGDIVSNYLKVTNFGFSLPSTAIIGGIRVELDRHSSDDSTNFVQDYSVKIIKSDGTYGSANKADISLHWPTVAPANPKIYGGYYDNWSETWTAADINSSNFGFAIANTTHLAGICLAPDTLISTPDGDKPISQISVGDLVYSFNLSTNTTEIKPVIDLFSRSISHYNNEYFYITGSDNYFVKATWNHDFFVDGEWKKARDLQVGDTLKDQNFNDIKIVEINVVKATGNVWDITVADHHNFFANGILVHNASVDSFVDNANITVYFYVNSPSESPSVSPSNSPSLSPSSSESASNSPSPSPYDTIFIVNTGKVGKRIGGRNYIQLRPKPSQYSPTNQETL